MLELFDAMKNREPNDEHPLPKMREDVFVNNVMKALRIVLPSMTEAYDIKMRLGGHWGIKEMQEIVDRYKKSDRFRVETNKSKSSREKTGLLKHTTRVRKVNNNSQEEYQEDAYYDEQQVLDDGQPRADSFEHLKKQKELLDMQLNQFDGGKGYGGNGYREPY